MLSIFSKKSKAFTLLELIVVIAIIAILVLVASPKLMGQTQKAKLVHIKNDVKVVETVTLTHMLEHGKLPDGNKITKVEMEDKVIYNKKGIVESIEDKNYTKLDDDFVKDNTKTKLDGDFVSDDDGDIIYVDTDKIKDDKPNNAEGIDEKILNIKRVGDFLHVESNKESGFYNAFSFNPNVNINKGVIQSYSTANVVLPIPAIEEFKFDDMKNYILAQAFYYKGDLVGLVIQGEPGVGEPVFVMVNSTNKSECESLVLTIIQEVQSIVPVELPLKEAAEISPKLQAAIDTEVYENYWVYDLEILSGADEQQIIAIKNKEFYNCFNEALETGDEIFHINKIIPMDKAIDQALPIMNNSNNFIPVSDNSYKHKDGLLTNMDMDISKYETINKPQGKVNAIAKKFANTKDRCVLMNDGSLYWQSIKRNGVDYKLVYQEMLTEMGEKVELKQLTDFHAVDKDNNVYRFKDKYDSIKKESIYYLEKINGINGIKNHSYAYNSISRNDLGNSLEEGIIEDLDGNIFVSGNPITDNKHGLTNQDFLNGYVIRNNDIYMIKHQTYEEIELINFLDKDGLRDKSIKEHLGELKVSEIKDIKIFYSNLNTVLYILDNDGKLWQFGYIDTSYY